jgi:hypothetical protein
MYTYKKYYSKLFKKYINNPTACRNYIVNNNIPQPEAGSETKAPNSKSLFSTLRKGNIYERGLALEIILGIIIEDHISKESLKKYDSADEECIEYFSQRLKKYLPEIPRLHSDKLDEMEKEKYESQVRLAIELAVRTDKRKFSVSFLIDLLEHQYFFVKWFAKELLLRKTKVEFDFDTLYKHYQKYDRKIDEVDWNLQNMDPAFEAFYCVDGYALMHLLLKHFPKKLESSERYTMKSFVFDTKDKHIKVQAA